MAGRRGHEGVIAARQRLTEVTTRQSDVTVTQNAARSLMIHLLALSGISGAVNLVADSLFLVFTLVAPWQVDRRVRPSRP